MSHSVATGLNITKAGSDPPLKDDKDLPEWVWGLAQQERSLADLRRASQDSLDFEEVRTRSCGRQVQPVLEICPRCFTSQELTISTLAFAVEALRKTHQ